MRKAKGRDTEEDMGKTDVFLSYEHSLKSIVDRICAELENDGIRCWYAPRDVIGDYATSIVSAIDEASVFVVLLNNESSRSPHVLNEVEMAYKRIIDKEGELTILPLRLDNEDLSKAMEYYVKRMHWIDATTQSVENAVQELKHKIKAIIKPARQEEEVRIERKTNMYFDDADEKEKKRLKIQQTLLESFDKPLYDKIANEKQTMRILDLGCNNGDFVMNRLGAKENVECLLGLECNAEAVAKANEKYGSDKICFEECCLECDDLEKNIRGFCEKYGISDFNVVNVSMLILHLKDPLKLLKTVRRFLKPSAKIIVKDIDDGLNIAYPDNDGLFEHAMDCCLKNELAGYRYSGRQIFGLLHKAGFRNIRLVKSGMDTSSMNYDEREALFMTYFSFIKNGFDMLTEKYPDNALYAENAKWMDENYDALEDAFLADDFFFTLGFMLFEAER